MENNNSDYNRKLIDLMPTVEGFTLPEKFPIPCGSDLFILQEGQKEVKTKGGIILPQSTETNNSHNGVIYSVGPGCSYGLRPGLKVIYDFRAASISVVVDGKPYMLINEGFVKAVLNEEHYIYDPKSSSQIRLEKKQGDQATMLKNLSKEGNA